MAIYINQINKRRAAEKAAMAEVNEKTSRRLGLLGKKRVVPQNDESALRQVLEALGITDYELEDDDELWLVVDKDRWTEAMLSRVATECSQEVAMHMALSNPCFELWLLLHLEDAASLTPVEQKQCMENRRKSKNADPYLKVRLRQKMGSYHESSYDVLTLIAHIEDAIERARALDKNPNDRWPQTLGTRVYLLAESVMNRNQ